MKTAKLGKELADTIEVEIPSEFMKLIQDKSPYLSLVRSFPLVQITNQTEHVSALGMARQVTEHLAQNEDLSSATKKAIISYLDALTALIEKYEQKKFSNVGKNVTGVDMLRFLMEEHGFKQTDLGKELGGQSVVSELLSGKRGRQLNRKQIEALSKRFHVSPSVFF